jgi:hypothetical protein
MTKTQSPKALFALALLEDAAGNQHGPSASALDVGDVGAHVDGKLGGQVNRVEESTSHRNWEESFRREKPGLGANKGSCQ